MNLRGWLGSIGISVLINIVLPYAIYSKTEVRLGAFHALLVSSLPPLVWGGVEFLLRHRVDMISLLGLVSMALSSLAMLGRGSVRFLQMRESLAGGAMG